MKVSALWRLREGGFLPYAGAPGGEAGLKTHRQRIYDDFYAVAKDLVDRKITSPQHLGTMGGNHSISAQRCVPLAYSGGDLRIAFTTGRTEPPLVRFTPGDDVLVA